MHALLLLAGALVGRGQKQAQFWHVRGYSGRAQRLCLLYLQVPRRRVHDGERVGRHHDRCLAWVERRILFHACQHPSWPHRTCVSKHPFARSICMHPIGHVLNLLHSTLPACECVGAFICVVDTFIAVSLSLQLSSIPSLFS